MAFDYEKYPDIYLIIFRLSKNNENMRNEMKKSFSGRNKSKFIMVQH